ncbi:hypothetical protein [Candidatus Methylacidiphilum infernorum]|uniref:Uncharacterized protein n=1 Tax=Methylacidiphilum infernorum (isolate V4) TaxID=481448 RepID=B3DYG2_METI4|nr:hypothetical protein [Candidatus Methylacidiphilum infernorum]ACD84010.1 Conserved hypothetical protein [Methylacidiphilum infernorum V4]
MNIQEETKKENQKTILSSSYPLWGGTLLCIFLSGFVFSSFYAFSIIHKQKTEELKEAEQIRQIRVGEQLEARKRLSSYGWIDKEKGIVHVPIEEAMVSIVKEYKAKTPKASGVYLPGIPRPQEPK